jgi:hypothetical protein
MATRKLQIYVSDGEYQFLKQAAGENGSMAEVVRQLIDNAWRPADPRQDPFYRYIVSRKQGSERRYDAEQAKRELYRRSR